MWQRCLTVITMLSVCMAMTTSATPTVSEQQQLPVGDTLLGKFESDWPIGDPRRCMEQFRLGNFQVKRFEVLPGIGWDNLRNQEAGMVVSYNYSQCKVTEDGTLLIPDNVFTVPIKSSVVESFAELYDHWTNASSTTSNSINVNAGLSLSKFSISGSFSWEHEKMKSKQVEDKSVTTRVQLRYNRYEAKLQPDPVLSQPFRNRILSIAANIELNRTEEARYEGQLLVRDFGTHVITSVTAGAGLSKDDYLKRSFVEDKSEDKTSILASASASFFGVFHISTSYGHKTDSKVDDMYNKWMTNSYIKTNGGPLFRAQNMTIDDWTDKVDENLVPMDRAGDPLYFLVTPTLLSELPPTTVAEVEKIVRQSVELYYEMNVIPGCTKLGSPNFSFSANFDDGSCHSKPTNLTFGGVFQTCSVSGSYLYKNPCEGLDQVNPKTGQPSCPPSYTAVLLHQNSYGQQVESKRSCHKCGIFGWSTCCHTDQYSSYAVYSAYWCAATGPVRQDSGYLFGGLYTSLIDNPVTKTRGCPSSYYPRKVFTDLSVCISDDFELGEPASVPFGGFFSCEAGNPLSADGVVPVGSKAALKAPPANSLKTFMAKNAGPDTWPSKCPSGYSQHMATTDNGCSIHYCVQTGFLSSPYLPPIKRPPFMIKPPAMIDDANNIVMFDMETNTWTKNPKASMLSPAEKNVASSKSDNQTMSPGVAAGISVGATLACVAIATVIIVTIQKRRARRRSTYRRLTQSENSESPVNYGSTARDMPDSIVTNEA